MTVNRGCGIRIIDDPLEIVRCKSFQHRPFLRLTFDDGTRVDLSFDLAKMIGFEADKADERERIHRGEFQQPKIKHGPRKAKREAARHD